MTIYLFILALENQLNLIMLVCACFPLVFLFFLPSVGFIFGGRIRTYAGEPTRLAGERLNRSATLSGEKKLRKKWSGSTKQEPQNKKPTEHLEQVHISDLIHLLSSHLKPWRVRRSRFFFVVVSLGTTPNTSIGDGDKLEIDPYNGGFATNSQLKIKAGLWAVRILSSNQFCFRKANTIFELSFTLFHI